jgi:GH24 family phage-related lysozyme (muramidase)
MANIVGETLRSYVIGQINARQTLHGSGVFKPSPGSNVVSDSNLSSILENSYRTDKQLNILNSNTSWIKLASGVFISGSNGLDRLKQIGFTNDEAQNLIGDNLAKNYILYAGTSEWQETVFGSQLNQRQGFLQNYNPDSSYLYSYTPVTLNNGTQVKGADFGYSPMPGIISAEIKSLNRGSLEKAFIKIRANDRRQLDILDILYMRLGYTVLLEWGNSIYTSTGTDKKDVRQTLIEKKFFQVGKNRSYFDFLGYGGTQLIEQERANYDGNYDGMLAVVSNFSWTFNPDGTYDIDLTLISMGDVVESLKSNVSIDAQLKSFIDLSPELQNNPSGSIDSPVEKNKDSNIITSALWLFKRFGPNLSQPVKIELGNGTERKIGNLLKNGPAEISTFSDTYQFYYLTVDSEYNQLTNFKLIKDGDPITYPGTDVLPSSTQADQHLLEIFKTKAYKGDHWEPTDAAASEFEIEGGPGEHRKKVEIIKDSQSGNSAKGNRFGDPTKLDSDEIGRQSYGVHTAVKWVRVSSTLTGTVNNPIDSAHYDDACVIDNTTPQYYLRFGYLLQFLTEKVIPLIKGSSDQPPLFSIDYSTWSNHMYSLPNQISLDPRVCIVKNLEFQKASGTAKAFSPLRKFKEDNNKNAAYPMNIYLNFEFIISSLESNTNERGDVNIYGFISSICTGLNKALGGINNLEPIIDKNENVLRIIEGTPIPGYSALGTNKYELNLFGYQKSGQNNGLNEYTSNFIRKVDLKTAITPEYATMVTVGATANGYVKGTEATAFSRWNKGIIDRFKDELISPNPSTTAKTGGKDEAEYNYVNDFLKYPTSCYGYNGDLFSSSNLGDIDTDIVKRNLSIVTEFYKYIIAKAGQKTQQAGTIGFIPFKLGITMDGISGIKIYNKLEVNSRFLPTRYGETLNFIITGVNHRLQDNDWETSLETIVMPKTTAIDKLDIDFTAIVKDINNNPPTTPLKVEDLTQFNRKVPKVTSNTGWEAEATNFIALKESFSPTAAWDINHYRGGYGSDKVYKNGKLVEVTKDTTFTKEEAVKTLEKYSIYEYSEIIIKALGKSNWDKLNNHQKAALVSLAYNAGKYIYTAREYGKKIVKALKKGDYQEAAQGILDGPKTAGGEYLASLARRRKEEAQLFLYPANKSIY